MSNIFADEAIRFLLLVSHSRKGKEKTVKLPTLRPFPLSPPTSPFGSFSPTLSPLANGRLGAVFFNWVPGRERSHHAPRLYTLLIPMRYQEGGTPDPPVQNISMESNKWAERKSVAISDSLATQGSSAGAATIEGEESGLTHKPGNCPIRQGVHRFRSDSPLNPLTSKRPTFVICKFKSKLALKLTYGTAG